MALFDCDELLGKLKIRGMIPVASGSWTDAYLLGAASDEAETWLMPMMIRAKGEYLVKTQDIPFVAAQSDYRFNSRVAAIREVSRVMADGTEVPLEELSPPQMTGLGVIPSRAGVPMFYKFKEGVITLFPVPGQTGDSLRVKYHYRLNRMALAADTCTITSISGGTIGVTAVPTAMGSGAGVKIDFIRSTPIFDVVAFDVVPASFSASATSLVFSASDVPADLVVGDRVALARYTPFPNMPPELHVCAALRAAASAIKSKGDKDLAKSLVEEAIGKEASLLTGILEPRNRGGVRRLVTRRFR